MTVSGVSGHGLEVWRGGIGPRQQIIDLGVEMAGDDAAQDVGEIWICFGLVESGLVAIRPAFRTEPD